MSLKNSPLLLLAAIIISSCSGKKATPENVALDFYNQLFNEHNLEKASELVTAASKEKLRNDFKFIEGALQIVQEATPTTYIYKVDADKSKIGNDSAFIHIWTSLDSTTMETLLIKENETWLVDFNYTPPVDAFNKELIDDVLTEMQQFVDTVTVAK
ncbi:MAG: hypothetical protein WBP31_18735 [Chitinophagales bacterium]|jgi:hypothetical protein|nr:DUF4878 domain-containing protein [Bacteroidota bacterium]MBK9505453.1 DUF4878 domain-containing protein [Bacteroidota bacterium]MBK9556149.1 DUF4878 domain-containing protein [Bacteroidota bacterium]MBL0278767.1 DUF4878 domain-containing protein [Bacteroidota bacterium]